MLKFLLCFLLMFQTQDIAVKSISEKVSTDGFVTFEESWEQHKKDNSPVIVVITSKTCSHCKTMKNTLLLIKKDYPDILLCEISYEEAKRAWPKAITNNSVPQTFMYAWDNEENKRISMPLIIGSTTRENIYKAWKMK